MMNEKDKGLRGLGGTKMVMSYTDVVMEVLEGVQELTDDNGVDFQTNLSLYLEGLEEDVLDAKYPHSIGPYEPPVRPKEQQDVE
jgi:hypothetical protein|tara:strand:- start:325 stop:576 length:252 start_codon:yes stop_codon:yes gene_type:complete